LRNLLALADSPLRNTQKTTGRMMERAVFAFCSSVASVSSSRPREGGVVEERISMEPGDASPLGYSRSKWVAEGVCGRAAAAVSSPSSPQGSSKIGVFRVGQLSGDTAKGIWNANEAWPLMLGSVRKTGCLPDLEGEVVGWLAVDIAARAMVEGAKSLASPQRSIEEQDARGDEEGAARVFHILNPHATPTFSTLLGWLGKLEASAGGAAAEDGESSSFEVLPPREWLARLEKVQVVEPGYPALRLLGLWRGAYGGTSDANAASRTATEEETGMDGSTMGEETKTNHEESESVTTSGIKVTAADEGVVKQTDANEIVVKHPASTGVTFGQTKSKEAAPAMRDVRPVDEAYFEKLWGWIVREVCEKS